MLSRRAFAAFAVVLTAPAIAYAERAVTGTVVDDAMALLNDHSQLEEASQGEDGPQPEEDTGPQKAQTNDHRPPGRARQRCEVQYVRHSRGHRAR